MTDKNLSELQQAAEVNLTDLTHLRQGGIDRYATIEQVRDKVLKETSANLSDITDEAKGAALVGRSVETFASISDMMVAQREYGRLASIKGELGFWQLQESRYLIAGQSFSEMTFDDDLNVLSPYGGMWVKRDLGYFAGMQAANRARFAGKLKDLTTPITVDCYGDSITFGQALPDTVGATNNIGTPTGFGDGSLHDHWQFNAHYPQWVASFLANNVSQTTTVNNFGYSGDRVISGYLRHRVVSGADVAIIMYGINETLFASANGATASGITTNPLYSVEKYADILRLFVAKQIAQGKYTIVVGSTPFASLVGFDGTQYSAQKLARAYNAAAKAVAIEFGCPFIDAQQEIFAQYGLPEITQEGVHLGPDGLKILGQRLSAALVMVGDENRVTHGSVLLANPSSTAIVSKAGANILPNSTSTTPRGTVDNQRTTLAATSDWITVPFYAEQQGLVAFINGLCSAAGATFDIRLDDGAVQSDFHFQGALFSGKPTSSKQLTKSAKFTRENINISDDAGGAYIIVANKGWHSISIRKVSGASSVLFDSISFESLASVIASDKFGVTASCSVAAGALVSGSAYNVSAVTEDFPNEFAVFIDNDLTGTDYTVVADADETGVAPVTCTVRYKAVGSFAVAFNRWNGTAWVQYTPSLFTVKVIGGR